MALVTHVATEAPRSPRDSCERAAGSRGHRAALPRQRPSARPATYAALNEALRPFGSTAPTAANLGSRVAACVIDWILLLVVVSVTLLPRGSPGLFMPAYFTLMAAYFTLTEGLVGASVAKWIFELRVTDVEGGRPGVLRASAPLCPVRPCGAHTIRDSRQPVDVFILVEFVRDSGHACCPLSGSFSPLVSTMVSRVFTEPSSVALALRLIPVSQREASTRPFYRTNLR